MTYSSNAQGNAAASQGITLSCRLQQPCGVGMLQLHKLESVLIWHLQHGVLQDADVLQQLVMLAATDGNVAVLGMLIPIFERTGWLVSS
jgi:hypothetical protein